MGREEAFVDYDHSFSKAVLDAAEHVTRMLGGIKLAVPVGRGGAAETLLSPPARTPHFGARPLARGSPSAEREEPSADDEISDGKPQHVVHHPVPGKRMRSAGGGQ